MTYDKQLSHIIKFSILKNSVKHIVTMSKAQLKQHFST